MVLNRRKVLLSATVGAAGAVMTNTVSAKERNLDQLRVIYQVCYFQFQQLNQ